MRFYSVKDMLGLPLYIFAGLALMASILLPPSGYGEVSVCAFKNATGRSCFGCGMTRGVTSISHIEPEMAWSFHPFAFLLWPIMILLALSLIPHFRRGFERQLSAQDHWITPVFWSGALGFLVFGVARLIWGETFWL
ncbi:MAG: DUF2752 domain-containing protein [Planctomycetota bacterium]